MHSRHFYGPDDQEEWEEIEIVNALRRGTDIEATPGKPKQYNKFKNRIIDRVRHLAREMLLNNILVYEEPKLRMAKAFKDVWDNGQDYWEQRRLNTTIDPVGSSYDKLELYDNDEDDFVPPVLRKNGRTKDNQPISQAKVLRPTRGVMYLAKICRLQQQDSQGTHHNAEQLMSSTLLTTISQMSHCRITLGLRRRSVTQAWFQ